ncbi:O-antigen translocase [Sphingomonas sp. GC_Shp_1]|uniref:O-antigen translocase n=3 Tax=unclassified Sphingomonas TaxID=196159 RepID=UPI00226B8E4D|nr:O-antigen translocase [Sphingomonas sp. GC_Shp_1]
MSDAASERVSSPPLAAANSRGNILRATSMIGGASMVSLLVGLSRMKVAALVLGPVGVGLIGLFQNFMQTATAVASLGLGTTGTRQIAEATGKNDEARLEVARVALFWGSLFLALAGAIVIWVFRLPLAQLVVGRTDQASTIGWLGLGVALSVAAGAQTALLTGLRRVRALATLTVGAATVSAAIGVTALLVAGPAGIVPFVIAAPVASFVLGIAYVRRIPHAARARIDRGALRREWCVLATLGLAFTVAGAATTAGQLAARTLIQHEMGPFALGQFQAAWLISITYINFVLQAMTTDFYPRLSAVFDDKQEVNRVVNDQAEIALMLAAPILLGMMALAPWVTYLLYSNAFAATPVILQWQILGDALKIASWPLGYLILASGDGRTFMMVEIAAIAVFILVIRFGLRMVGLEATGIAVLAMYLFYLPLVYMVARHKTGFQWQRGVVIKAAVLAAALVTTFFAAGRSPMLGAIVGMVLATAFGVAAVRLIGDALPGAVNRLIAIFRSRKAS